MKSEAQKILEGTNRSNATKYIKGDGIKLKKSTIELSRRATAFRKIVFEYLKKHGAAYKVDFYVLDRFALTYEMLCRVEDELMVADSTFKMIQEFKTGARQTSPEIHLWNMLTSRFEKYSKMFGLTPLYRENIVALVGQIKEDDENNDVLSQWLADVNGNLVVKN